MEPQLPGPTKGATTDWTKCCLCQKVTDELLQCSAKSKRHDVGVRQGYSTLATNIMRFSELRELPMCIDVECLDDGSGIEATFTKNNAKWLKSCHTKFNTTKLKRAEKRKHDMDDSNIEEISVRKYTRQSSSHEVTSDFVFFCEKAKMQIQWNWQEAYGEDHFVIMLGGLHIEMAGLKVIGDWLEDSGWVEALVQAKVASAGTANSFVNVSHITRTR